MRLFAQLLGSGIFASRRASPLSASFSSDLRDAIDSAVVAARAPDDDGPRVMVICHSLRGAFISTAGLSQS